MGFKPRLEENTMTKIDVVSGFLGAGKTTLIKMINGLLAPTSGLIFMQQNPIGAESKKHISYLPDHTYLNMNERVRDIIRYFSDFYEDFDEKRAYDMLGKLQIDASDRLKTMSKGTKEKVQLILVMSRHADLYILDEPIAGVDPAARDFILNIIPSAASHGASAHCRGYSFCSPSHPRNWCRCIFPPCRP